MHEITHINPYSAKHDYNRFKSFYQPFRSQLMRMKCMFKHQALQIMWCQIKHI